MSYVYLVPFNIPLETEKVDKLYVVCSLSNAIAAPVKSSSSGCSYSCLDIVKLFRISKQNENHR